ncbi:hypothetical protein BST12_11405 [Mycobacterium angelicum]|uniref:Uncharacterized protein n=1 Tax=Mycobacterium angelicum TaxID=470074 RepID=A0A1W9ZVE7_MYCAN|nr:hypothetical protein BST12_11405 [Mycobacterium angelicum]
MHPLVGGEQRGREVTMLPLRILLVGHILRTRLASTLTSIPHEARQYRQKANTACARSVRPIVRA